MCGQFDTFLALIGAWMGGNDFVFEIDGEGAVVRLDSHLFADCPGGHGVDVRVEANGEVGVDLCRSGVPAIGEKLR